MAILCVVHTVDMDLIRVGGVNRIGNKSGNFRQSRKAILLKTVLTDLFPILFTPPTRESCLVRVSGVKYAYQWQSDT